MRIWLLAAALTGCIDANLVECADGRLCPRGTACDVVHHSCVAPDQLTACVGLPEWTLCQATGVELGRCFDGVCLPGGCGNTFLEPEELCDDGNVSGGDGCSNDCRSREICGDGFVDILRGEGCDDGNTLGRDGCTNRCTSEAPHWRHRTGEQPAPRWLAAGAWDTARGALIMVGGADSFGQSVFADTWTLSSSGWTSLPNLDSVRSSHAMATDPIRHKVVMFGGLSLSNAGVLLNDTLEWNGATWERKKTIVRPMARSQSALAWDGARLILFGGTRFQSVFGDTWAWNGETWVQLSPATSPSARDGHAMVFDAKRHRLVLFGGSTDKDTTWQNDTWIFDGTTWSQLATGVSPPALVRPNLAFDAGRGIVVLSAAQSSDLAPVLWELDGATWTMKTATNPDIIIGAVLAYDTIARRVIQVGGRKIDSTLSNEIWEWDGTAWSLRSPPPLPVARELCALASDPLRGRVVMFGGYGGPTTPGDSILLGDTWEWDGALWTQRATSGPPARGASALAYDGTRVVMFGGDGSPIRDDTWVWDGQFWFEVPVSGPPARFAARMVYDVTRGRVVLFGGRDANQYFNDTWEWDGAVWTQIATPVSPPARVLSAMAYDIGRGRTVLFGGVSATDSSLDDTWEYDGTTWTPITTITRPEARVTHNAVYDRARGRVAMFGGVLGNFSLWEWDGVQWTEPELAVVPFVKVAACATYDDARRETVAYGGVFASSRHVFTMTGSYLGDVEEVCAFGDDLDGDGASGCADADCRGLCEPACWQPACGTGPRCGDATCSALETDRVCAQDCAAAAAVCGDWYCSPGEICDADCP